jgi:hypothetical protein
MGNTTDIPSAHVFKLLAKTHVVEARAITLGALEQNGRIVILFTEKAYTLPEIFVKLRSKRANCNKSIPQTTAFNGIAHRLTKAAKAHSRAMHECLAKGDLTKIDKDVTVNEKFVQRN